VLISSETRDEGGKKYLDIYISCIWNGDLDFCVLNPNKRKSYKGVYKNNASLYISMPNKLMYMINLDFDDLKSTNNCCETEEE
jgi:hypothetical protein